MINIMSDKLKMIINIVGFYIGWWGCILGSSDGLPYIGPLLMLLFIIVHVAFFVKDYKELQFIILIVIIGTIVDSGLVLSEYFVYAGAYSDDLAIAPLWITAMWAGFAATVNHSMVFFQKKWILMVVAGGIFGPAAYFTGKGFGAIYFELNTLFSALIIGVVWAISMPMVFYINEKMGLGK